MRTVESGKTLKKDDEEAFLQVKDYVAAIQPVLERIIDLRRDWWCRG